MALEEMIFQAQNRKTGHSGPAAANPSSALFLVCGHRQELSHVAVSTGGFSTQYTESVRPRA
jgi:hypothetical protein